MAPLCEGPCWHDISSVTAVIQLWAHFDPSLAVEPVFAALQLTCVTPHVVGKLDVSITESTAIKTTFTVSLSSTIALPHCTTITLQRCQSDGVLVVSLSSSLRAAFTFDVLANVLDSAVKQAQKRVSVTACAPGISIDVTVENPISILAAESGLVSLYGQCLETPSVNNESVLQVHVVKWDPI